MKLILAMSSLLLACRLNAAELTAEISFTKDVAPIFVSKCLACHNADKAKGHFRLHTCEALNKVPAAFRMNIPIKALAFDFSGDEIAAGDAPDRIGKVKVFNATKAALAKPVHAGTKSLANGSRDGEVGTRNEGSGKLLLKFIAVPGDSEKLSRAP